MHRPVLAPIVVSPLRVPVDRAGDGVKQEASSFLLLDSPMSLCQSPFSTAESRRTSQTSYDDLLQDLQEDTEQWASCEQRKPSFFRKPSEWLFFIDVDGLHMEHSQTPSEEGLVNSDWIDGGEGDSPTTGDFAAASASGSQRGSRSSRAVPRFSPVSSQGSSWSSSRRPGAPSVVLSFQTNSQFQLSAPPSRRSHNSRGSSSSLGSNFSFSAANQIALANRAARPSVAASSSFGGYTASNASTHRHSVGSATGPDAKASDAEEEHNLTPAQAFMSVLFYFLCGSQSRLNVY